MHSVDSHAQAAKHDGDKAAGAGAADHVKVVAGLGRGVGIDGGHEPAEDHEGQAADAAAVEGEQAEAVAGHMDGAEAVRRLRHKRAARCPRA